MFKEKGELSIINKVLIVMLVVICVFAVAIILLLQFNKKNIETHVKETQGIIANNAIYAVTEENTWDVSKNADGSVIATLAEDGTLTISGTGKIKDWGYNDTTDWHNSEIKAKVKKVVVNEGVTSIGNSAFYTCKSLVHVNIPNNVTSIEGWAFSKCSSLTSINIPGGVTNISHNVFDGCSNLTSIKIPKSVTSIGSNTFSGCYNLTIMCYKSSTAETYAIENNIKYQLIYLNSTEQEIDEVNLLIKRIQPSTTVEALKKTLQSEMPYEIINSEGNILTDTEVIGTGYEVKLENGRIYKLIIYGDVNGDGQADLKDILAINKHRLNKANLIDEYLLAGDVNEDEKSDLKDILQINKYRLGKISEL